MYTASRKKDKTEHRTWCYIVISLLHYTQASGQNHLTTKKKKKKETLRDMLEHDEKVTGDFLIRKITQSRIGAYITPWGGKSHHKETYTAL